MQKMERLDSMRTKVLMSPGRNITNPYVRLLMDHITTEVAIEEFTWRRAFLSRYEVLHVHWPETLIRARSKLRGIVKCMLFLMLIVMNKILHRRHVWTVHNLAAHEQSSFLEGITLRLWRASCQSLVYMNRPERLETSDNRVAYIPHGDYAPIVRQNPSYNSRRNSGQILLFGFLRPYKGIEELIESFRETPELGSALRIVGKPLSVEFQMKISALASSHPSISFDFRGLSDSELLNEIAESELVILPYKKIYNSGAALMALSAACPIVVTNSSTMTDLQREVGAEWVQLLEGDISPASLTASVLAVRAAQPRRHGTGPKFVRRDWTSLGEEYSRIYRNPRTQAGDQMISSALESNHLGGD